MKKVFFALAVISFLFVLIGSCAMSNRKEKLAVEKPLGHTTDVYVQSKDVNPDLHTLKAGETFEGLFIKGRRLTLLPDDSDMTFSLFDINKQFIREEKKLVDWKQYDPYFVTFRTEKQDKKWFVEKW